MIGIQEYGFNSFEGEEFKVYVWEKEPEESGEEYEVSIENSSMDSFRFESIETLDIAIEALQKAKGFVLRQGKQVVAKEELESNGREFTTKNLINYICDFVVDETGGCPCDRLGCLLSKCPDSWEEREKCQETAAKCWEEYFKKNCTNI